MIVTFVSQCEKKALRKTRRVLDAFANRIGSNTWQTVITQEGLLAVKKLLRKTASKNTAVSCHWIRSRARSDLVWVVGSQSKFNAQGLVPVNTTQVNRTHRDDRADWRYLPLIQALTSLAALLHDWGKASERFQQKLSLDYHGKFGDALRHEWVSCLLLKAFIEISNAIDDNEWLNLLKKGELNEARLQSVDLERIKHPLSGLPSAAKLIAWLLVSHHRLPLPLSLDGWDGEPSASLDDLLILIDKNWGYENHFDGCDEQVRACLHFPKGLVSNSTAWMKEIKRWAGKLLNQKAQLEQAMQDGSYRLILHHARLCLMLGDHYYSSLDSKQTGTWKNTTGLIANTQKDGAAKQALDQHLIGVCQRARYNVFNLPRFEQDIEGTDHVSALKKLSPPAYAWQDTAVAKVRAWKTATNGKRQGFFAVNMAGTGCGKTFANAKVMLALTDNRTHLRYILALGLRTLTLQTGHEYRERIFSDNADQALAVLVGSKAIVELHEQQKHLQQNAQNRDTGSESQQTLLSENDDVHYTGDIPQDGLSTVLKTPKDKKFLFAPVLACTIDHIMAATETTRGGRYILPALRLMSSDLVIDEIDDFSGDDLIAIGRLIHLAGMLGRKVMISSATIPPALAEGYFNAYREGWLLFSKTREVDKTIGCAWIDEFGTVINDSKAHDHAEAVKHYAASHKAFIEKRVSKLHRIPAKHKANIVDCESVLVSSEKLIAYYGVIVREALTKHSHHHFVDALTSLSVSFGVIRMANISPCVDLSCHFLSRDWPEDTEVRLMAYHSQQVLLLRHEQEKHLDAVLKRKEQPPEPPVALSNTIIRQHLDTIAAQQPGVKNVLFIVVATPVEEVGRDHDFDWGIVEPSSYRSIIQLAGRVKRHRGGEVIDANIGLLQYNWKTLRDGDKPYKPRFYWPGYESGKKLRSGKTPCFKSHRLNDLLSEKTIAKRLDATPRIMQAKDGDIPMAALEHAVISDQLKYYQGEGPDDLQGYLSHHWYLTGLPQTLKRFRRSERSVHLFRVYDDASVGYFTEKDSDGWVVNTQNGNPTKCDGFYSIEQHSFSPQQAQRLWFYRDYRQRLSQQAVERDTSLLAAALRYGELVFREPRESEAQHSYWYNDQLGLFKNGRI